MPNISVIIPIYNVERYLMRCIESILKQSYRNFELILIDDGSTDKSGEICDLYRSKDERIKVIHKVNDGASEARNTGIENSNGNYICFVDGDDWIENNMLKEINNVLEMYNPDLIINGLNIDNINLQGICSSQENKYKDCFWKDRIDISNNIIKLFENALINSSCNKIYKADIIRKNNIRFQNTNIGEDTKFNLEVLSYCEKIKVNDKCYYHYMRYNNVKTLSGILEENSYEQYMSIHKEMIRLFKQWRNYSPEIEKIIARTMLSQYLAVTYKIFASDNNKYPYKIKKSILDKGLKSKLIISSFKNSEENSKKETLFRLTIRKRWYRLAMILFNLINSRRKI